MKLLVTGSGGYIGKNFMMYYKNKYLFSSFSLQSQKLDSIDFKDILTVVHCAALVHQTVEYNYDKYYEVNVTYPYELAKLAKQNGVKQFVFLSTVAVYGDNVEKIDATSILNPNTYYAKSKLEAEKKLLSLNDENFIVSIVRPSMVYGQNAPGNIDRLIKLIKRVPVLPFVNIKNKRSFIYIGNLCYLIDEIINQYASGIFLASDDRSVSTSTLIKQIAKNLDKKVYLLKFPFFESLLKMLKPSFHKRLYGSLEIDNHHTLKRLFGELKTSLPYSLEEGIRLMIKGEKE